MHSMEPLVSRHHGLLGTVIELQIWAPGSDVGEAVERVAIDEIERLQRVFNVHDPESELRRWLDGAISPSAELEAVLSLATMWRTRSAGAFDPAAGALADLWDTTASRARAPSAGEVDEVLRAMRDPTDPRSRPSTLNAIAKGWVVDRSLQQAMGVEGALGLTINAGGDLLHRGPRALLVGIEDPQRPFDNAPPLLRVRLPGGALATSGGSRRGWRIGERWYSHVIDPRSGQPVDQIASASVLAPDAATADAVATVLSVSAPAEGLAFAGGLEGIGCCIVERDGTVHRNAQWLEHELDP